MFERQFTPVISNENETHGTNWYTSFGNKTFLIFLLSSRAIC